MGIVNYLTIDGEIVSETRGGVDSDYIPDPLGSTAKLINTSQQITDGFYWWPYGEQRSRSGLNATPFGFVGTAGYFTDSTGNRIHVQTKSYRPNYAGWQQEGSNWQDDLGALQYTYASPVTLINPTGEQACPPGWCHRPWPPPYGPPWKPPHRRPRPPGWPPDYPWPIPVPPTVIPVPPSVVPIPPNLGPSKSNTSTSATSFHAS